MAELRRAIEDADLARCDLSSAADWIAEARAAGEGHSPSDLDDARVARTQMRQAARRAMQAVALLIPLVRAAGASTRFLHLIEERLAVGDAPAVEWAASDEVAADLSALEDALSPLDVASVQQEHSWVGPPMSMANAASLLFAETKDALKGRIRRSKPGDPLHIFQPAGPGRIGRKLAEDAVRHVAGRMRAGADIEMNAYRARLAEVRRTKVGDSRRRDLQALDGAT